MLRIAPRARDQKIDTYGWVCSTLVALEKKTLYKRHKKSVLKSTDPILSTQSYDFLWAHWKRRKKGFHHQKERDCYLAACLWQKSNLIHCSAYWFHTYLVTIYTTAHGLRTPREEISFTARPKIHFHSQIFMYGRNIFCLSHRPSFSDVFDLCLHWMSVVRGLTETPTR